MKAFFVVIFSFTTLLFAQAAIAGGFLPTGMWSQKVPVNVKQVVNGNGHTCALLDNSTVKCWGANSSGQLGLGDTNKRGDGSGEMGDSLPAIDLGTGRTAVQVSAGYYHTCVLLDNSTVKCWGHNAYGQLGLGDTNNRGDGSGEMGDSLPAINLGTGRTAVQVSAGYFHTCVLLDNSTVKCWGHNAYGQLGLGDTNNRGDGSGEMGDSLLTVNLGTGRTAVQISSMNNHTCTILDNSTVKCWGANFAGPLGLGDANIRGDDSGEMGDSLPAINLGTGRTAVQVSTGVSVTCALLDNSMVKCWGGNGVGSLGLGDTTTRGDDPGEMGESLPAVKLGTAPSRLVKVRQVANGSGHTCALLDNSTVKCWGRNNYGQLGLGDTNNRGDSSSEMGDGLPAVSLGANRTALQVSTGAFHTCVLLDNGSVKCWGRNNYGQLGLGDTNNRGDSSSEMGDNLPVVSLGTSRTALQITTGVYYTCALLDNGSVKCWGENFDGQLGLGDMNDRGDGAGEMGNSLPAVSLGTNRTALQITTGIYHTCALLDNGSVKCWGDNDDGQLGRGDVSDRGDGAGEMGDNLAAVNLGANRTALQVAAGGYHTCALLDNGSVKCWGNNLDGQLGLGDTNLRGDDPGEMGANLPAVNLGANRTALRLDIGDYYTCALLDNGNVKCWGFNGSGQLGLGDMSDRGDGSGEMGNSLLTVNLGSNRTVRQVSAGQNHTCALLDNGSLKCWGENTNGQLGLGDTIYRGDGPSEMGDSLSFINLGTSK